MSGCLSTYAVKPRSSDNTVIVYWERNGTAGKGCFIVDLSNSKYEEYSSKKKCQVGELAAIRHLVFEKVLFGDHVLPDSELQFKVTHERIGQYCRREVTPNVPFHEVMFLYNRLSGTQFTTHVNNAIPDHLLSCSIDSVTIEPKMSINEPFYSQSIGHYIIADHAVSRYNQFNSQNNIPVTQPRRRLIKKLGTAKLHKIEMSNKTIYHKKRTYGENDKAVHYRLGNTPHHVTVLPPKEFEGISHVVTYYKRED